MVRGGAYQRGRGQVAGDNLAGTVTWTTHPDPWMPKDGKSLTIAATIEGDKLGGFWRGDRDGKPILTKSSKLGGTLAPAK